MSYVSLTSLMSLSNARYAFRKTNVLLNIIYKPYFIANMADCVGDYAKTNGMESKTPFLIGVAGGTASGKSTVCQRIMEKLGQQHKEQNERRVVCISQDSFYRALSPSERLRAERGQFNFDHPDAFDDKNLLATLKDILAGKRVEIPSYDYITNSISPTQTHTIYPADVVLIEGILVFYFPEVRELFHMKLFVDTDSDTRLARRVPRDIMERGRDLEQVLNQYMNFVKPAFEEFCLPTKKFADVIIPRGADNTVAIDLIVHHIWDIIYKKNSNKHLNGTNNGVCTMNGIPNGTENGVHNGTEHCVPNGTLRRISGSSEDTLSR